MSEWSVGREGNPLVLLLLKLQKVKYSKKTTTKKQTALEFINFGHFHFYLCAISRFMLNELDNPKSILINQQITGAAGLSKGFSPPNTSSPSVWWELNWKWRQRIMMASVPDRPSDVLWQLDSFATDPVMMKVILLTGQDRQCSHVEKQEWERQRGGFEGIKGRRGGVTVGNQQASNYLPTGDLTP